MNILPRCRAKNIYFRDSQQVALLLNHTVSITMFALVYDKSNAGCIVIFSGSMSVA